MTSRSGLEIRAAAAADGPGLAMLLADAGHQVDAVQVTERLLAARHASGTALIATQWGPPNGFLMMHWYPTIEEGRPVAQITHLLVGGDSRRQGIGRLLIKAASQVSRVAGCGKLEIVTASDAVSLQEFCRATGFDESGLRFARSLRKQG